MAAKVLAAAKKVRNQVIKTLSRLVSLRRIYELHFIVAQLLKRKNQKFIALKWQCRQEDNSAIQQTDSFSPYDFFHNLAL